jgi:hypothetical protein
LRFGQRQPPFPHLPVERDLDVHLLVRAIDAGAVVDEVGVDPAAALGELDPRRLGDARLAPSPITFARSSAASTRSRVVGGSPTSALAGSTP